MTLTYYTRIRKGTFIAHGGLSNPKLFRRMRGGIWTYWRIS